MNEEKAFSIVDGDTVKKGNVYFRALYIDTPELKEQKPHMLNLVNNESCLKEYGKIAKDFLEKNKNDMKILYSYFFKDKYGRFLAEFNYINDSSIELEMVEKGYAICFYREPLLYLPRTSECLNKEDIARKNAIGIWSCKK